MEIEDVVGVKFGIENEIDMENGNRGWDLEDIAGDSLRSPPKAPTISSGDVAINKKQYKREKRVPVTLDLCVDSLRTGGNGSV
jgi:hypothetical protein